MAFRGFVPDTTTFLAELGSHNDRAWFAANKERYERVLLEPQRELVAELAVRFDTFDPRVRSEPRVDGSIFRIHRDIRFGRDKSPYKTWADIALWMGRDRKSGPGYFMRIVADGIIVGGGEYHPTASQLAAMRRAIVDASTGEPLVAELERLASCGWAIGDETHKRVPTGFPPDGERSWLLKYGRLHAGVAAYPPPREFYGPELADLLMERFAEARPLVDWLAAALGEDEIA